MKTKNSNISSGIKLVSRSFLWGLTAICLTLASACTKDFDKIDTNEQGFTTATDGSLLNSVIQSLIPTGNEQFYINNEILYKQTQQAALTRSAWGNYNLGTEDIWNNYYRALSTIRELEKRVESYTPSAEVNNMKGIIMILKAYKTFKVTDLFGDIPYSYAGYGFQNLEYLHPVYDTQRSIYLSLLDDLKWANDNMNDTAIQAEPFKTFASFDQLFDGNLVMWKKFANSLRLRYAIRMSEKEPEIAGNIVKDIIENELPVLRGLDLSHFSIESAALVPINNSSVSWSFREHNGLRMGSNMWHQLSENDAPDGSGIFDPRAYIFFEGDENNAWKPFPQVPDAGTPSAQGIPYAGHRDDAVYFGLKTNVNYSPFNFFLIDDEDNMPIVLMNSAEVYFLIAEAWFRGIGVPEDKDKADNEYMNGIYTSVEWWMTVAKSLKLPLSGIKFEEKISIPESLNLISVLNHFGSWNATTDADRLRFIYTQKWIDLFRQPGEAYAEARRLHILPREGEQINHFRLPYPTSETQYNTENYLAAKARQGGDDPLVKIWWIP